MASHKSVTMPIVLSRTIFNGMIIMTASLTPATGKQNPMVCVWFVGEVCDSFSNFLVALFLASFFVDCD